MRPVSRISDLAIMQQDGQGERTLRDPKDRGALLQRKSSFILSCRAYAIIWVLSKIPCSRNGRLHAKKILSRNFRGTIAVHVS